MIYVTLGLLSYFFFGLFELASLRRLRFLKLAFGASAGLVGLYAFVMVVVDTQRITVPVHLIILGAFLLLASGFLLVYSIFLEIPFRKTYVSEGTGEVLIKTGTYALVRHPGVLWMAIFLTSLVLVSRSQLLLFAAPLWFAADAIYVYLEEKFYLERIFQGYEEYQRETPMLVPTPRSVRRCVDTLRWPKAKEA